MAKILALLLAGLLLCVAPPVAVSQPQSSFGRMFPIESKGNNAALEPLNQQTNQQLADIAQTMLEPAAINNPKGTTGGVTFFGQFIDHDLTLDTEAQPTDTSSMISGAKPERATTSLTTPTSRSSARTRDSAPACRPNGVRSPS